MLTPHPKLLQNSAIDSELDRRRSLCLLAALGASALTSGCGFKLRTPPNFAFETIAVIAPGNGAVAAELRNALSTRLREPAAPNAPAGSSTAQVNFDLLQELRERTVVGVNAAGQVRELQLRLRVKFRLRNAAGKDLIEATEIAQVRDISFTESAVLAKEVEEARLVRDMQTDIVQQLMRRLAAVTSIN